MTELSGTVKKTLVIHPLDPTTDFLKEIYDGKNFEVINYNMSKSKLCKKIKEHDRIIMMGHGWEGGLFGFNRIFINSQHVYLLREKECIYIWCNADKFVEKYGLKSQLFTGMIISEDMEANLFCVNCKLNEIDDSNRMFAQSIRNVISDNTISIKDVLGGYVSTRNPIVNFNRNNIFCNVSSK